MTKTVRGGSVDHAKSATGEDFGAGRVPSARKPVFASVSIALFGLGAAPANPAEP